MIAEYEAENRAPEYGSPRQYALSQEHKHLPEMQYVCGLDFKPVFNPIVSDYYSGMCVTVPLHVRLMRKKTDAAGLRRYFEEYYAAHNFIKTAKESKSYLPANPHAGTNDMEIYVDGNGERIVLAAVFDNLGKGASGAAVQCMNIMLGLDETLSLR